MRQRLTEMVLECSTFTPELAEQARLHAEYVADHLLASGVIVPPCKVGDVVYEIQPIRQRIQAYDVTTVKYNGKFYWFTWVLKDRRGHYGNVEGFSDMQIGKTVFLTREEAEEALKKGGAK